MEKFYAWVIVAAVLGVIVYLAFFFLDSECPRVCIDDECFVVEVADTPQSRGQGLMFREHLDEDAGMLFIFDQSDIYSFYMRNTLIPLDMIWVEVENGEGTISHIHERAVPLDETSIVPLRSANMVLEINGGEVDRRGISQEDSVRVDLC